jgi:hypothetical protein
MATGHAAGTAAAVAAKRNSRIRDIPIRLLQRTLLEQGAILSTNGRQFSDVPVAEPVAAD